MKTLLAGMMGTGKSTLGRALAANLGVPFVDTDALLEAEAGVAISVQFARDGEPAFRAREASCVRRLLADPAPAVVALGGGALVSRALRHEALDQAHVITLRAKIATLLKRTSRSAKSGARPLLAGAAAPGASPVLGGPDPHVRLEELSAARAAAYAENHAEARSDDGNFEGTLQKLVAICARFAITRPVAVPLGLRSYQVQCVRSAPNYLREAIAELGPSSVFVVSDSNVERAQGEYARAALAAFALPVRSLILAPGEISKTLASVNAIWDAALGGSLDRDAVLLAFGGGVVGDMAGFAAATLLRGLRVVQVPTTLLAMADSSVGGKTGFDHASGKNRIGAMHQPSAVVCDLAHLSTLPPRELRAGLAELVKIAAVADAALFEQLEAAGASLLDPAYVGYTELVRAGIAAKARIVRDDEDERGARKYLNFGHTVGHGLEAGTHYDTFLHGEAVALGMVQELALGVELGVTSQDVQSRVERLLATFGLPMRARAEDLRLAARYLGGDKKRRGAGIDLPLATTLGAGCIQTIPITRLEQFLMR